MKQPGYLGWCLLAMAFIAGALIGEPATAASYSAALLLIVPLFFGFGFFADPLLARAMERHAARRI